jgi:hypothetical protein
MAHRSGGMTEKGASSAYLLILDAQEKMVDGQASGGRQQDIYSFDGAVIDFCEIIPGVFQSRIYPIL